MKLDKLNSKKTDVLKNNEMGKLFGGQTRTFNTHWNEPNLSADRTTEEWRIDVNGHGYWGTLGTWRQDDTPATT